MNPDMLIHPGEVLKEEFMEPFNVSANKLASHLKIPTNRITQIINGERGITGETAILLGIAFRTSPQFWLNLQARYNLDKANVSAEARAGAEAFADELVAA
jgi:addiction module HigA family antidote